MAIASSPTTQRQACWANIVLAANEVATRRMAVAASMPWETCSRSFEATFCSAAITRILASCWSSGSRSLMRFDIRAGFESNSSPCSSTSSASAVLIAPRRSGAVSVIQPSFPVRDGQNSH